MKIIFIQCFRVVNALRSRERDLALQPGIMASSNGKYTDQQITFILSEQTLHSQLCLQCAWGDKELNVQSNRKSFCWMKRSSFLPTFTYITWHLLFYTIYSYQYRIITHPRTKQTSFSYSASNDIWNSRGTNT